MLEVTGGILPVKVIIIKQRETIHDTNLSYVIVCDVSKAMFLLSDIYGFRSSPSPTKIFSIEPLDPTLFLLQSQYSTHVL